MNRPSPWQLNLGASYLGDGRCRFRVWAPDAPKVDLHLFSPVDRVVPMLSGEWGYQECLVEDVRPGALYKYRLNDALERPDPASRYQPHGIHEPSAVVDPRFAWTIAAGAGFRSMSTSSTRSMSAPSPRPARSQP